MAAMKGGSAMKGKRLAALLTGCVLCISAAMPASAAVQVDAVYLSLIMEEELYALTPGDSYVYTTPVGGGDDYYISDAEITQSSTSGAVTYTLDVRAADGWYFNNNTMVSVYGAYDISVYLRTSTRMRVTAKAYPFRVLDEVTGITIDSADKKASWAPVDGARNYSVIICYADQNGSVRRTRKSSGSTSIDLKSYMDRYDYVDVAVRPLKGSSTKDRYTAEPNYINSTGGVDEEYYVETYEFRLPTSVYGSLPNGSTGGNPFDPNADYSDSGSSGSPLPSGSGSPLPGGSNGHLGNNGGPLGNTVPPSAGPLTPTAQGGAPAAGGWQGSGNNWYYVVNGVRATGWLSITPEEWYFLDNSGLMCAGWFNDGSEVYLLNPNHDGSYGRMLTGYQSYNGYTYYFNQSHDGSYGAMYKNRYTPDGRWADGTGVVR